MKILEIRLLRSGQEVAYIFDEDSGAVKKVFVEDYTNGSAEDAYMPPVVPSRRQPVFAPARTELRQPQQQPVKPDVELDEFHTTDQDVPGYPVRPRASIIPPGLGGLFIDKEDPRADKVTRKV